MRQEGWRTYIEVVALTAIGIGLWMAWPPLCPIVLGSLVLAASIYGRKGEEAADPVGTIVGTATGGETPFVAPDRGPSENRILETSG